LDFTIPYEWLGMRHEYRPDYLVRLRGHEHKEIKVILEVKGFETEQDRQKETAALRWVKAVNYHGEFGKWAFAVCRDPRRLESVLQQGAQNRFS
jgi:type III restriction enzyme